MTDVMVAGGGRCGLHASRMLAERGLTVTLVERLPQAGGQEPDRDAATLVKAAQAAGVKLVLGTLAVEYRNGSLSTLGIDGATSTAITALVLATGTRPRTRAELNIGGERGSGVLPGSAALHFLDAGLLPGRRPVVIGAGELAHHLSSKLLSKGAERVTVVTAGPGTGVWQAGVQVYDQATPKAVLGFPRLHTLVIETADGPVELHADSVILAAGRIPMRNIEGAVFSDAPTVYECFSTADPKTDHESLAVATETVRQIDSRLR